MPTFEISSGEKRTRVDLRAHWFGSDLIVYIYNENAHIGAVAIGEYDPGTTRTSTSVMTRLGHKDDAVAKQAAYKIGKQCKRTVCVIAGIHIDDISKAEIEEALANSEQVTDRLVESEFLSRI